MQLKKGQIVELEITKIAFGGAGIGKYEGLTVFVEGVMVGDRVRASFTRIKPKFAEAELVEVVKESKDRVKVKCPHFFKCGGCQLQFMPYKMQLEMKKQHVVDSFERIGKIFDAEIFDVIGCEEEFYYRNKMEFSFGYDANMNFTLGMHVPGRRFDIMDIDQCYLESEFSVAILNKVREVTLGLGWKSFKYSAGEGFLRALYIREGKRTGEVMVNLVCSDDEPEDLKSGLEKLVEELRGLEGGNVTSIYYSKVISRRGIRRQVVESVIYGKKSLSERLILENGDE
ncbi:MAG: TRAM domain-containing protein, partial [Candidatus Peregrinibacteria bacterium]